MDRGTGGTDAHQQWDDFDPEAELRKAVGTVVESQRLLHLAIGAHLIEGDWQPGQPIPDHIRRLEGAESDLAGVLEALHGVVGLLYG